MLHLTQVSGCCWCAAKPKCHMRASTCQKCAMHTPMTARGEACTADSLRNDQRHLSIEQGYLPAPEDFGNKGSPKSQHIRDDGQCSQNELRLDVLIHIMKTSDCTQQVISLSTESKYVQVQWKLHLHAKVSIILLPKHCACKSNFGTWLRRCNKCILPQSGTY